MEGEIKTILLVEDEVIIALSQKQQLERSGYRVSIATNGEDSVREATGGDIPFDVILMDIDLGGGIDGTQAAERILKIRDVPVIFLSSHTEPSIVEKTENITSYGYVVKNSAVVILEASIKMALKLFNEKKVRKEAEKALGLSAVKWESTFNAMHSAVWVLDGEMRIELANKATETVLMKDPKNIAGLHCWEVVHGTHEPIAECPVARARRSLRRESMDLRVGDRWLEVIADPVIDENDAVTGFVHLVTDITERKRIEEDLRKGRLITENIPVGLHLYHLDDTSDDKTLRMVYANPATQTLTGLDPRDVVGKTLDENFPGLREKGIPQRYAEVVRTQKPISFDDFIYGDDRVMLASFSINAFPLPDDIVGIAFENITSRKRAEEQLRESQTLYHDLVETSQDLIWQCDPEGRFTYLNPSWGRLFGYPLEEMIGKNFADFQTPAQAKADMEIFTRSLGSDAMITRYETVYLGRDGAELRLVFNAKVFYDTDGRVAGSRGTAFDVTDRKRAEDEVKRQLAEKETLLREVHHRIKNNMASVAAILSLQADSSENEEARAALQNSVTRVQSIMILYDKLLLTEEYKVVSVKAYVESLLESFLYVYNTGNRISVSTSIGDFAMDSKKAISLGIIMNELLTNVFKYAFAGRDGEDSITIEKDGKQGTLTVWDNGIGIGESPGSKGSSGLGLVIIKTLVQQMNGTYGVMNENGTKSDIRFEI